jgi:hypothetical protein
MREKDATTPKYVWGVDKKLDRKIGGKHWYSSAAAAANKIGVCKSTISVLCTGQKKKCKINGYYIAAAKKPK